MNFIVPTMFAVAADYTAWVGGVAPANITAILRGCTTLVLDATKTAVYTTDPATGLATDTVVKDALRDATCIQAAAWVTLNIDPVTGGVMQTGRTVRSKRIGSAVIDYVDADVTSAAAARAAAYTTLVPEAFTFLRNRGLITTVVGAP
ncbi:MAG: hypothetical protein JSS52_11270 [Proteobacteria bacterium]|nr:hypothetical protein [Pseudomonadota bacterium]